MKKHAPSVGVKTIHAGFAPSWIGLFAPNFWTWAGRPCDEGFGCFRSSKYLLIGGYAVNYHGHHRFTADIDFWVAVEPENAERLSKALQRFGFSEQSVDPKRFLLPGLVHQFGVKPVRIDLLTGPAGVTFDECYARRVKSILDGVEVPIISLADLRKNKSASGRDKDLLDVKNLPTPTENP